jgi:hypothetical protein
MDAAREAYFLRNGLPKSESGGFRGLIKGHATASKARRRESAQEHDHEHELEGMA